MPLVDNAWYVNFGNGSSTGYYAVTAWGASASKVCGNLVRQSTTPSVGNERVFVCIASTSGTGQTGGSEPTWTVTRGAKNTDNTVTWQEATGIAALNGDLTNTPNWTTIKNTAIVLGQVIQSNAGDKILICTTAGTAGNGSEPSWATFTNAGATTADNTVTWTTIAAIPSGFTGWSAPHARLANAFAANWGQAGNSFFIASDHTETQASAITLTSPGTAAGPCLVYCVTKTTVPPTSANLTTGASITTTGNSGLTLGGTQAYYRGIAFICGTGANTPILSVGMTYGTLDSCALSLVCTGSTTMRIANVVLANTTVQFGSTGQTLAFNGGRIRWLNTPSAIQGATLPTTLFGQTSAGGPHLISGVDLSALGSGKTLVGSISQGNDVYFVDCKLGSSVTINSVPPSLAGSGVYIISSDSGATNYRNEYYSYAGTQTIETTIIRTGGASDGTTPISWKLVNSANSKWIFPFESLPITIWNDTTGSSITVTLYGIWGGGAVPNNDDIWIEAEYPGDSASPQGAFVTSTKANNLASGSALSSDSSTWGGSTTKFKMSVTFTPQMKGPINLVVKAAKASSTFYVDPKPEISGVTVSKSALLAPGVYANELQSGSSGAHIATRQQLGM